MSGRNGVRSTPDAQFARPLVAAGEVAQVEVTGRSVPLMGLFSLGASFERDGSLVVSDQTSLRRSPRSAVGALSAVLMKVHPGEDPRTVFARLREVLPASDTRAMTVAEYEAYLHDFMQRNTLIEVAYSFGV